MKIAMLLIALSFWLVRPAVAQSQREVGQSCQGALSKNKALTFDKFYASLAIGVAKSKDGSYHVHVGRDDLTRFWKLGWPYLLSLAADSDMTVYDFFEEYWTLLDLIAAEIPAKLLKMEGYLSTKTHFFDSINQLQAFTPNQKLKPKHWQQIGNVYAGVISLGRAAIVLEETWRETPSFDPFALLTTQQLKAIFESLEGTNLDQVSQIIDKAKQRDAPAVVELPVEEPSIREEHRVKIYKEPNQSDNAAELTTDLATVLKNKIPLKEKTPYVANTRMGYALEVVFEKPIVKEYAGNNSDAVWRLLHSIFNSNGSTQGIKMLPEAGKHVVEIKARLHGHKRIFGCLDGRTLVLKKFDDIQANRAAYARQIPTGFCD